MIIKYQTEKGYSYLDNIKGMTVYTKKYDDVIKNDCDYVKEKLKVSDLESKKEDIDSCQLYWSLRGYTNVDFVDMEISTKHLSKILGHKEEDNSHINITFVDYRRESDPHITRTLVFIGNGWLISERAESVGKTIERIG